MPGIQKIEFSDIRQYAKSEVVYNPLPPFASLQVCSYPPALECGYHSNLRNHISLILSGEMIYRGKNVKEHSCRRGTLIILPERCSYLWRTIAQVKSFQGAYSSLSNYSFSDLSPFLCMEKREIVTLQLDEMQIAGFENDLTNAEASAFRNYQCSLAFLRLLAAAFETTRPSDFYTQSNSYGAVLKCLKFIGTHLHSDISIQDLVKVGNVSRRKLFMLFDEHLGMPPLHYISRQKIHLARQMIETGRLGTSEIAEELGFASANYFIRFFKKHTGTTPSALRKEWMAKYQQTQNQFD